ncbi:hypothetical protein GCM10011352_18410 [Marinobacterium zhoushanense]|uniref:Uncharacterized protein n=1 Tax=Marinobacterium zhoushanense TaxID=1679163 RepID=A0ABQ1KAB8_9GAMM|nr:hypothetical protein [Marinobacterium zhoushanense]GGB92667.1 hypothetical protein GCM10011352_18410 [Marinobacterium zhoushanense]
MTRLTRTLQAFLLVLLFGVQSLSAIGGSLSADDATWKHWQFHTEHGAHFHAPSDAIDQADDHKRFENDLHADISHTGTSGLVFTLPLTDSVKPPSRQPFHIPQSHDAPHLGLDTPPPIV